MMLNNEDLRKEKGSFLKKIKFKNVKTDHFLVPIWKCLH